MLGCKDDAAFDLAFGGAGHHVHKVNHKFGVGMGNNGQVGIGAFGYFFRDFYVDLALGLLVLLHVEKLNTKVLFRLDMPDTKMAARRQPFRKNRKQLVNDDLEDLCIVKVSDVHVSV